MKRQKGFTLIELVIVLAIIAIMSAILLPTFIQTYNKQQDNIVQIYNGVQVVCYCGDAILYTGDHSTMPNFVELGYKMVDVDYAGGVVYFYFIEQGVA